MTGWHEVWSKFGLPVVLSFCAAAVGTLFGRWTKRNDVLVLLQVSMSGLHEKVATLTGDVSAIKAALRDAASVGDLKAIRSAVEEIAREGRAVAIMAARAEERLNSLQCNKDSAQERQ